ncbi:MULTISPECIES: hypothetical protein [unclassified Lysobacter]|uniref:DUF6630 family protein n=1 Tax=unclassified Lysobacter TaxID=2635362 RepID=UPI001BE9840B|nr:MULTISPECIES: hypothetical protein [unclassified Lysobacter]MBT2746109.1 hypothetical protein [Lysobacter sp. ISL-42]MBT2752544.1 hypothetical protein [Lysobacter sp. ISL-50]MBT2776727.1 hypothetical protein [Lysobacter sp. ISL-54]MBT2780705.1 hypothetical protein [Lysobacter sp. ISL-52]
MSSPDNESDYEDDAFDFSGNDDDEDLDEETLFWQLLLLINPGDEETALHQFGRFRELREGADGDGEAIDTLQEVIDWTSGYRVEEGDTQSFIDSIAQLAARWNLQVDWGVDDPTDDEFLQSVDVPELMSTAHDRLREHGYTVWNRDTRDDTFAGWITLRRDDETMQAVAAALGVDIRPGSDAF